MQPGERPAPNWFFSQLVGDPELRVTLDLDFVALMMGVMIGHDRQFRTPSGRFSGGSLRCGRSRGPAPTMPRIVQ